MRNGTYAGFTDADYSIGVEASGEYKRQDQGSGSFDIIWNIESEITIPKPWNHDTMNKCSGLFGRIFNSYQF